MRLSEIKDLSHTNNEFEKILATWRKNYDFRFEVIYDENCVCPDRLFKCSISNYDTNGGYNEAKTDVVYILYDANNKSHELLEIVDDFDVFTKKYFRNKSLNYLVTDMFDGLKRKVINYLNSHGYYAKNYDILNSDAYSLEMYIKWSTKMFSYSMVNLVI